MFINLKQRKTGENVKKEHKQTHLKWKKLIYRFHETLNNLSIVFQETKMEVM